MQARNLFEKIKREGHLPGAERLAVRPEKVGAFYVEEFQREFVHCLAADPQGQGQVELSPAPDVTVKIRYQGNTLTGGNIETEGSNGNERAYWYHECGERGQVRLVGIGADRNDNVTHAAVFSGDLESRSFTVELAGDRFALARDEAFAPLRRLLRRQG